MFDNENLFSKENFVTLIDVFECLKDRLIFPHPIPKIATGYFDRDEVIGPKTSTDLYVDKIIDVKHKLGNVSGCDIDECDNIRISCDFHMDVSKLVEILSTTEDHSYESFGIMVGKIVTILDESDLRPPLSNKIGSVSDFMKRWKKGDIILRDIEISGNIGENDREKYGEYLRTNDSSSRGLGFDVTYSNHDISFIMVTLDNLHRYSEFLNIDSTSQILFANMVDNFDMLVDERPSYELLKYVHNENIPHAIDIGALVAWLSTFDEFRNSFTTLHIHIDATIDTTHTTTIDDSDYIGLYYASSAHESLSGPVHRSHTSEPRNMRNVVKFIMREPGEPRDKTRFEYI